MKKLLLTATILILSSCDKNCLTTRIDQVKRREILKECLESVPNGLKSTVYNDMEEVVDACGNQAYYMSQSYPDGCNK